MDCFVFKQNYMNINAIMKNYTKSRESVCALTKHMEVSFSSNSASSKASSSESTGSSVNCVTVSDTDASVPARKKTKLNRPGPAVMNTYVIYFSLKIQKIINIILK